MRARNNFKGKMSKPVSATTAAPVPHVNETDEAAVSIPDCCTDFRNLPDPGRTRMRMLFILRHKEISPTYKVGACIMVNEFYGCDSHRRTVNISVLLPASDGWTNRTRIEMLPRLEELGLINRKVLHKIGQDIELLF